MKPNFAALAAGGLMLLAGPAPAQPAPAPAAAVACHVAPPQVPLVEWRGIASYRAKATVKNGRVVAVEISSLKGGVERRTQRLLVEAVSQALRDAPCQPGEHQFHQDFSFDLRQPPASAAQG